MLCLKIPFLSLWTYRAYWKTIFTLQKSYVLKRMYVYWFRLHHSSESLNMSWIFDLQQDYHNSFEKHFLNYLKTVYMIKLLSRDLTRMFWGKNYRQNISYWRYIGCVHHNTWILLDIALIVVNIVVNIKTTTLSRTSMLHYIQNSFSASELNDVIE